MKTRSKTLETHEYVSLNYVQCGSHRPHFHVIKMPTFLGMGLGTDAETSWRAAEASLPKRKRTKNSETSHLARKVRSRYEMSNNAFSYLLRFPLKLAEELVQ